MKKKILIHNSSLLTVVTLICPLDKKKDILDIFKINIGTIHLRRQHVLGGGVSPCADG